MRSLRFALPLILLLLAACTTEPNQPPAPTVDLVATQVSVQLTALPSPTSPPPTPTLPPTEMPATLTPEPSPTATVEATTTSSPDDPRVALGSPTWSEGFENGKSYGLGSDGYSDDQTAIRIDNGALTLTSKNAIGYHGWRTGGPVTAKNAYVEGTFNSGNCAGEDHYGLVLRSPDYVKGYWFMVDCNGEYTFGYWDDGGYVNLLTADDTSAIFQGGPNQTNRLGVQAEGNRFRLYANGKLLQEITDETYPDGGRTGAVIAANQTPNYTIRLEEIAFWNLP